MKIQFLYFEDCPNSKPTFQNLSLALQKLNLKPEIERVVIADDLQAEHYSFQGSPSIKLNGIDLWEETRSEYHMGCRVYKTPTGLAGLPTVEMILKRLNELSNGNS
jgi:hypothetical protein